MKRRFSLYIVLFYALIAASQIHVSVGSPETWSVQTLAQYVGQTVEFDVPMVVCSNRSNLIVAPWRMYEPLSQGYKGSAGHSTAAKINTSAGFTLTNAPKPVGEPSYRCGEKIYHLQAIVNSPTELSYVSGEWRGNTRAELEQNLPDVGDYRLLVCAFNLENYFVENMGSLGARNYTDHKAQREKISKALTRINADIFGLVELEQGDAAIQEIVDDLNKNLPSRNYAYFHESASGASQKSDYVYDTKVVEPIGKPSEINTEVSNRKKMICFREKATGEKFIYSINHFKAMTGGAEATNARRVNEARAVYSFYNTYRRNASIKDNDILIMGDLNTYAFTEPIQLFLENGLIDLHRAYHADSSYSYMYGGRASYIDHALCNSTLYRQITGMAAYHINSDESDDYTYDKSSDRTMFRCSDHDPVLVGLKLDSTLFYDQTPQINSQEVQSGEHTNLLIQNAYNEEQKSYYAVYNINGWLVEQHEILSPLYEIELPQEPGVYIVNIYFDGQVYHRKMIVR